MSRKKHNVAYIKPNEPKFLQELKKQAGWKEGPTIDTKKEILPEASDADRDDFTEEQPIVVVLNPGDLTAEEAEAYAKKKEEEATKAPADLSKRIIFRKTKAPEDEACAENVPVKKKVKKEKRKKAVLSFDDNEDEYVE